MSRYVPKCKENPDTQVAILAVLADSAERRAAMEDQDAVNNPYVVEVDIEVDEDRQCIPAEVPADAVTLVMVKRYKLLEDSSDLANNRLTPASNMLRKLSRYASERL